MSNIWINQLANSFNLQPFGQKTDDNFSDSDDDQESEL